MKIFIPDDSFGVFRDVYGEERGWVYDQLIRYELMEAGLPEEFVEKVELPSIQCLGYIELGEESVRLIREKDGYKVISTKLLEDLGLILKEFESPEFSIKSRKRFKTIVSALIILQADSDKEGVE